MSEDALVISTAILAAPYAVLQLDSLEDPGSSSVISVGSQDGEAMERAMALEEAARALWSLMRGWKVASSCFMYSTMGGVGEEGRRFAGVFDDGDFFRK